MAKLAANFVSLDDVTNFRQIVVNEKLSNLGGKSLANAQKEIDKEILGLCSQDSRFQSSSQKINQPALPIAQSAASRQRLTARLPAPVSKTQVNQTVSSPLTPIPDSRRKPTSSSWTCEENCVWDSGLTVKLLAGSQLL